MLIAVFPLLFCLGQNGHSQTPLPVLYFSDITSGPRTGNTDTSLGQIAGEDGAIVTIYGRFIEGATVYCNGVPAAQYYYSGNASVPANLFQFHRMEMISFQVNHLAQDGDGSIFVMIGGRQSNSLPFTVRPGGISFVKTSGDDNAGTGTWTSPWRTIIKAKETIAPGDIVYVCDGVNQTEETENGACVNLGSDGLPGNPKALLVYPGAISHVGIDTLSRAFQVYHADSGRATFHWVIARFMITTREIGVSANTGWRVIGNFITAPHANGLDGAIGVLGSDVVVAGNELFDVGDPQCDKLYHAIYISSARKDSLPRAPLESNRDIGWNYVHDCHSNRAINIYSEQDQTAFLEQNRIHDNVIMNQHGDGILLGYYVTGENWIYNNLIVNAGLGPTWAGGEESYHTGIRINCGHELRTTATIHCYNNTIFGCGWGETLFPEMSGQVLISPEALQYSASIRFVNNIVFSTGEPYMALESGTPPPDSLGNCWYNDGEPPSWDLAGLNADPQFVDTSTRVFELQSSSPCRDIGQDVSQIVHHDLIGLPRLYGSGVDFGAFEYNPLTGVDLDKRKGIPGEVFVLEQNYPNPFNPHTTISFTLFQASLITLKVFDLLGHEVATLAHGEKAPGRHAIRWDASGKPSGVYFYRLSAQPRAAGRPHTDIKKLLLLR